MPAEHPVQSRRLRLVLSVSLSVDSVSDRKFLSCEQCTKQIEDALTYHPRLKKFKRCLSFCVNGSAKLLTQTYFLELGFVLSGGKTSVSYGKVLLKTYLLLLLPISSLPAPTSAFSIYAFLRQRTYAATAFGIADVSFAYRPENVRYA